MHIPEDGRMVLRTEGLVKKYGKRTVVNHVSINVKQGEIVGLLGPNGAGKTTSFYMTTGLIVPNEGHIFLNDLDITKYPVYKRAQNGIGYLAQEASVFRKMSVEDKTLPAEPFLTNTSTNHWYGLAVDPHTSEVYVADAIDYVQPGFIYRYSAEGERIDKFQVGVIPGAFCFNY